MRLRTRPRPRWLSATPGRGLRACDPGLRAAARAFLAAAALACGAVAAEAQERADTAGAQAEFTLDGEVVDAENGRPLVAAVVKFPELARYAFAGVDGRFTFSRFPAGHWEIVVEQDGYHASESTVEVSEGNGLHIRLRPDPIALEGLTVRSRSQRLLASRRRRTPYRIVTLTARDFAEAVDPNPLVVLKHRARAPIVGCSYAAAGGAFVPDLCVLRRGRRGGISVFLDESPLFGGTEALGAMHHENIHSMDFILRPTSGELRVYTKWFVRRLDETRVSLSPILW